MIGEIFFILHVGNGIYMITYNDVMVYLHFFRYEYLYTFTNTVFRKYHQKVTFLKTFSTIYSAPKLSKKFSLTYTMFEVLDGNSLSQRFRKGYQ